MKQIMLGFLGLFSFWLFGGMTHAASFVGMDWNESTPVTKVLIELGEPAPAHYLVPTEEEVKKGEEIVLRGFTTNQHGRKTEKVSKHYVCTSCHNLQREDPVLTKSDPEARLPYVKQKGIPFLQGTTFWGITNRESWYNDDYVKKYGSEKIEKAHKSLREAIQLCAIECSQGRPMEAWEIDAVLAYYWSLELKMKDLDLTKQEWDELKEEAQNKNNSSALIQSLKRKYALTSPAHFFDSPESKRMGYKNTTKGNPAVGKDIYDLSCMYCHQAPNGNLGVSHYILDDSKLSFQHLKSVMFKTSHMSLYQIIPYGTYAIPGHKPYMPHYPLERMSKQQVEDLRAYIFEQAKKK